MNTDLTRGPIMRSMLIFSLPMVFGNILQQGYNVVDTLIVGQFLGKNALAAVGSSFTLMTFLTSILFGLCMGSSAVFSIRFGERDENALRESLHASFALIAGATLLLNILAFLCLDGIQIFLHVPVEIWDPMREYLKIIFWGIAATFFYNYFASFLRALGNSLIPLIFLAISAVLNIILDLWFVLGLDKGVAGAAAATVIAQYISGLGIAIYSWHGFPLFWKNFHVRWRRIKEIAHFSILTCIQQSVMNLGILLVQGRVNSFGPTVMAAFAAAVKIDAFAYMPVQDFGNAFSTFIAQNYGARQAKRIRAGLKGAVFASLVFCIILSTVIWFFAQQLMELFVGPEDSATVLEGIHYLHIEGAFYVGIGCLFLLYGLYRALGKPGISVVLTIISLGSRVVLAYVLSSIPTIGVSGIWWSVPIGWFLADAVGIAYYFLRKQQFFSWENQQDPVKEIGRRFEK